MPYIYENDPTTIGTNLQTAVAYLLSLHKDQYEWNLLGIKVIGTKEALPIPDGDYDYGDAYMIGTEAAGYQLWIYTRADEAHAEDYWFNVGAFPKPGPRGPKGDGLEQIYKWTNGTVGRVIYDTTDGAKTTQITTIDYTDSTDGSTKQQQFSSTTTFPIVPGKYVSMDATSDNKKLEVKVDDTALALDYFKIDKTAQAAVSAPVYVPQVGTTSPMYVTSDVINTSIASRDSKGDCSFHKVNIEYIAFKNGSPEIDFFSLYTNTIDSDYTIAKTPTDTGTLTTTQLVVIQHQNQSKNLRIVYDNQVYYRMDPQSAPDGTLNYIHIDSIQDGEGGYKATGKCFSVTVSTRAWQVIDLDFGGTSRTTHNLTITNSATGTSIYFTLTNNHIESYESAASLLWEALTDKYITCTVDSNGTFNAGAITTDGDNFKALYGNSEELLMTQTQISITDIIS